MPPTPIYNISTLPLNEKGILLTTTKSTEGVRRESIFNNIKVIHLYIIGSFQKSSANGTAIGTSSTSLVLEHHLLQHRVFIFDIHLLQH